MQFVTFVVQLQLESVGQSSFCNSSYFSKTSVEKGLVLQVEIMRKAIGLLIVLWGLSQFFSLAFNALDSAAKESIKTIEMAAVLTQEKLSQKN